MNITETSISWQLNNLQKRTVLGPVVKAELC